jgi:hypothetical protein
VATGTGTASGVRVEVTELKRASGGTVDLRFTLINDSPDYATFNIGAEGETYLVDPVGKKKYFVAQDSSGKCICSGVAAARANSRSNQWAKFAAPPDDVDRLSIVIPGFSPMDDVPLSR